MILCIGPWIFQCRLHTHTPSITRSNTEHLALFIEARHSLPTRLIIFQKPIRMQHLLSPHFSLPAFIPWWQTETTLLSSKTFFPGLFFLPVSILHSPSFVWSSVWWFLSFSSYLKPYADVTVGTNPHVYVGFPASKFQKWLCFLWRSAFFLNPLPTNFYKWPQVVVLWQW